MNVTLASFVITSALCYGIFRLLMWHLRRRRLYKLASKFEGPPLLPILGNAHMFFGNSEHLLNAAYEMNASYSSPSRVWLGPFLGLGVTDPEQIKAICLSAKTVGKGNMMENFLRVLVGEGLLTASASKWKAHRKLIQPTFNTKILDSFVDIFVTQSRILTDRLERHVDGPEFELFKPLSLCTLDMICATTMGVEVGAQTNDNNQYVKAVEMVLGSLLKRFFHFWLHPRFIFYRTKLGKDQKRNIKYLNDFVDAVIIMKKTKSLEPKNQSCGAETFDDACDSTARRKTFLELLMGLIDDSAQLSDKALRDEVMTMILTGNDTSANVMSFVMLMLALHPDIQDKVYHEICEIYGNSDSEEHPVTPKDLRQMIYLERVIKETLRLFPVGPFLLRGVGEDLNIGEHTIPTGVTVIMGILNLHRNEKYWPEPLKFDPDRFLPEENAKRHPYAYMAFSAGPRNCIGQHYAMSSMKTVIATVLRRYVLKKDNIVALRDIRLKLEIVMTPVDPIKIRIERRNKN